MWWLYKKEKGLVKVHLVYNTDIYLEIRDLAG